MILKEGDWGCMRIQGRSGTNVLPSIICRYSCELGGVACWTQCRSRLCATSIFFSSSTENRSESAHPSVDAREKEAHNRSKKPHTQYDSLGKWSSHLRNATDHLHQLKRSRVDRLSDAKHGVRGGLGPSQWRSIFDIIEPDKRD